MQTIEIDALSRPAASQMPSAAAHEIELSCDDPGEISCFEFSECIEKVDEFDDEDFETALVNEAAAEMARGR